MGIKEDFDALHARVIEKIKELGTRKAAGIIGLNEAYVSRVKNGHLRLNLESATRWAKALGIEE